MFGYGCSVAGTPSCGGVSRDAGDVLQLQTSGDRSGDGDYDDEEEHGRHEVIFGQTNVREDKEKVWHKHFIAHITSQHISIKFN